ncbi:TolB family protein, partial [Prevotella sp.]
MNRNLTVAMTAALMMTGTVSQAQEVNIGRSNITLKSDLMTPEALWAMGRIGSAQASPDGKKIVYQVGYYSVKENRGHQVLRIMDADGKNDKLLTTSAKSESDVAWLDNQTLAFLTDGQLWTMSTDGSNRHQLTHSDI